MYIFFTKRLGTLKKHAHKFLFGMRLTTILLAATMLQVSAATFGQKITYEKKETTLAEVFKVIKSQTGYNVVWYEGDLDVSRVMNVSFKDAPLNEVMQQILKGFPLTYEINNTTIIIKAKPAPSFFPKSSSNNKIDVHGIVTDEKGDPIPGATVKAKGSALVTATDRNGAFLLHNVDEGAVITISVIGYVSREINAAPDIGTVSLELSTSKLDEVKINAGYYSVTDRERTGDISKVSGATIGQQPVDNALMALEGRVPGLQITQSTGVPGGGFKVQIRGRNNITTGNDPLYLIDGVPYPSTRISGSSNSILGFNTPEPASAISFINPNDIESIEILKDADATAIYGSRGANGVILITTKKGKAGDVRVNAGVSQGLSEVGHRVDLLNTQQYVTMRKEAFANDGLQPGTTDYDVNGTWDQHKYTDWQKVLIGGKSPTTNASVDISGGNDKSNYLVGGNYYSEGTVFPGDFGLKRFGIRSNVNIGSSTDRLNVNFTATFDRTQSNLLNTDLTQYILLQPNAPDVYDQYGNLNWANNTFNYNPMAFLLQTNNSGTNVLTGNLVTSYKLVKNLTFKTSIGYTNLTRNELHETPLASYSPGFGLTATSRNSVFTNNYNNSFIAEPQLNYKTSIGKGKIDALAGLSFQSNNSQLTSISASNFNSDNLLGNIGSAGTLTSNVSNYVQSRYTSLFSRVNYELADKYFFNLTARRDGSSRFGPGRQYGNFGAIGSAWIFSEEKLIRDKVPFLSFGKFRASYGITGNDQINDYGYLQLWNTGPTYQGNSTLIPSTQAPNADYGWETTRKLEGGIQLGFFKDRINLEVDYYRDRSSNELLYQTLPLSTGLVSVQRNLPGEVQNTGWEFDSSFKIITNPNWGWSADFNLTIPKNKLLSYPGLATSSDAINYQIGQPLSILKTYNVTVNKQTGLYVTEDYNKNGVMDDGDRYIIKFLGQYFYGGFGNNFRYKNIALNFLFAFTKQNGHSYQTATPYTPGRWLQGLPNNQFSNALNRWQQPGDESTVQKFSTSSANNSLYGTVKNFGDISVVDASYIKLRNVSLSYTLPPNLLSVLKIHSAAITLQGQNLFTLTHYVGLDPETQGSSVLVLPPLRTIMVGVNLTL